MHYLGGRRFLVARGNRGIIHDARYKLLQPGIANSFRIIEQLRIHLLDIFLGVRKKIRKLNFFGAGLA